MNSNTLLTKVFDLIYEGDINAAEMKLEQLVKKIPANDHALCAAQSLLLMKQKKTNEAVKIAKSLYLLPNFVEPDAVNAVISVFLQAFCYEELSKLYERALSEAIPGSNLSATENLFFSYIHTKKFKEANKIAIELYKKTKILKYQIWSIMANLSQVPQDCKDHLLLKLSSRQLQLIIETHIKEEDQNISSQAVMLSTQVVAMYIDLLIQQAQFTEAFKFILSPTGKKIGLVSTRYRYLLKISSKASNGVMEGPVVNAVSKRAWKCDPNNWYFANFYLNSLQPTSGIVDSLPPVQWDDEVNNDEIGNSCDNDSFSWSYDDEKCAMKLCSELKKSRDKSAVAKDKKNTEIRPQRGPYLAEIQLCSKQFSKSISKVDIGELLIEYYQLFGDKNVFFLDIATVAAGEIDSINKLIKNIDEIIDKECIENLKEEKEEENIRKGLVTHHRRILRMKLSFLTLPLNVPITNALEWIQECIKHYNNNRHLSRNLEWSEEGLLDGYLLIAANIAIWQWIVTKDNAWVAIGLSVFSDMERKNNNTGALVLSTLLYQQIENLNIALLHQLDFKSIQFSSMDHIAYWPLERGMAIRNIIGYRSNARKYFEGVKQEIYALKTKVYHFLSWPKMKEIDDFEYKLTNCMPRQESFIYDAVLKLRTCQTIDDIERHVFDVTPTVEDAIFKLVCCSGEKLPLNSVFTENGKGNCNISLSQEDDTFIAAFIYHNSQSEMVRQCKKALFNKPDIFFRRIKALFFAASFLILHDVILIKLDFEKNKKKNKVKKDKNSNDSVATQLPLLCPSWGLNEEFFKKCSTNINSSWCGIFGAIASWINAINVNKHNYQEKELPPQTITDLIPCFNDLKELNAKQNIFQTIAFFAPVFTAILTVMPTNYLKVSVQSASFLSTLTHYMEILKKSITEGGTYYQEIDLPIQIISEVGDKFNKEFSEALKQRVEELTSFLNEIIIDVAACTRRK